MGPVAGVGSAEPPRCSPGDPSPPRPARRVLAPDAKRVLAFLDMQFGGSGRWTHPVAREDEQTYGELTFLGMAGAQAVASPASPASSRARIARVSPAAARRGAGHRHPDHDAKYPLG
jgi:hypothetical protein